MSISGVVTRGFDGSGVSKLATDGYTISRIGTSSLRNTLLSNVLLYNLVGERIYRTRLPDNPEYPCILYRSQEEPEPLLINESSLVHKLYQFEIYANTYEDLEEVQSQFRSAMRGGSFKAVLIDVNDDQYLDETRVYSLYLDYSIWQ